MNVMSVFNSWVRLFFFSSFFLSGRWVLGVVSLVAFAFFYGDVCCTLLFSISDHFRSFPSV